jgi:uncharacterized protein YutE (UPF0331/DUF86 family)
MQILVKLKLKLKKKKKNCSIPQYMHDMGLGCNNQAKLSQALQFQDWLVYEYAYLSRARVQAEL